MISATTLVNGQLAHYATGGRGLPVLFLHGWGLDHRAYQRSLRRLTARNCRVIAPSLPGFGGTAGLPLHDQSLPAFARWVDSFLDSIDIDEPVVVMGHSFGGGIATMFAHDHRRRVRHLVILNSVGDPDAFWSSAKRQGLGDLCRSVIDPVLGTLSPSGRGARARHAQRLFLKNATRDPLRVASTALVAVSADLRGEMANLAADGLPVTVLWSDRDGVIPMSAFDTFCSTFGAEGQVVRGGHSWLLASPDALGDVLENMIHVRATEHREETTVASTAELRALLAGTSLTGPAVSLLMRGVSPLWLLSAPASVLAADLTLCHPRLKPGEVRAAVQAGGSSEHHRLTVVATDRAGLLADTLAVLTNEGLSIESASAMTWPALSLALHSVTVHAKAPVVQERWDAIGARLQAAAAGHPSRASLEPDNFRPTGDTEAVILGESGDSSFVRVTAPDQPGLLLAICRWFADHGLSIEAADVSTADDMARDTFLVTGDFDVDELAIHLGRPHPSTFARLTARLPIPA
ncbi:MAG: alpha/beta fold hydrolase [Acidimicrobiales bacterium]